MKNIQTYYRKFNHQENETIWKASLYSPVKIQLMSKIKEIYTTQHQNEK